MWKCQVCERSALAKKKKTKQNTCGIQQAQRKQFNYSKRERVTGRRHSRMGWQTGIVDDCLCAANSDQFYGIAFRVRFFDFTLQNLMTAKWSSFVEMAFFVHSHFWQVLCAASSPGLHIVCCTLRSMFSFSLLLVAFILLTTLLCRRYDVLANEDVSARQPHKSTTHRRRNKRNEFTYCFIWREDENASHSTRQMSVRELSTSTQKKKCTVEKQHWQ